MNKRGILFGIPMAMVLWAILFLTIRTFGQDAVIPPPPPMTQQRFEQLLGEAYARGYGAGIHYQDQYVDQLQRRIIELTVKPEVKP